MNTITNFTNRDAEQQAALTLNRNTAIAVYRAQYPRANFGTAWAAVRQMSPELFNLPCRGSAPAAAPDADARNRAGKALELAARRRQAVADYQVQNRCSFEHAWQRCRLFHPDLFVEDGDAPTPAVNNRSTVPPDDAETANAIRDGIDELRVANRKLTYGAARDLLRRKNPSLFVAA